MKAPKDTRSELALATRELRQWRVRAIVGLPASLRASVARMEAARQVNELLRSEPPAKAPGKP